MKGNHIIGGMFGLECFPRESGKAVPFLTGRELFLVNARSGIRLLIEQIRPRQVWLPSYLCFVICDAVDPNITIPRFYEIDYNLKVTSDEWIEDIAKGDLVIFIDYFGFSYDRQLSARVKEKSAWIIEDAVQAMLSSYVGRGADFVLFSMRKWVGVPDGAILRIPENFSPADITLESVPETWWLKAIDAVSLRREFDDGVATRRWYELYKEIESAGTTIPYAMSQLSRAVIEHSVDYSMVAKKRIENYILLLQRLKDYALFPHIENEVVPLGFPVRVSNRDKVRQALFEQEIYPPVHWFIEGVVPAQYKGSHKLANEIMTLPCDQRYGQEDMERMANIFLKNAEKNT
jgi:hypothetical protein